MQGGAFVALIRQAHARTGNFQQSRLVRPGDVYSPPGKKLEAELGQAGGKLMIVCLTLRANNGVSRTYAGQPNLDQNADIPRR